MTHMSHVLTSHSIMMVTTKKTSEADTNPPNKRSTDKDGDVAQIAGASLSSASPYTSSWTPLTVIVAFSVDVS